jgi:hypothetical protein
VTGLADLPRNMVTDIVSAGRAIGHPPDRPDFRQACGYTERSRMRRGDSSESDESSQHRGSNEQSELSNEQSSSTPTPNHDLDETDDGLSLSDSSRIDDIDSDTPKASRGRQRNARSKRRVLFLKCNIMVVGCRRSF